MRTFTLSILLEWKMSIYNGVATIFYFLNNKKQGECLPPVNPKTCARNENIAAQLFWYIVFIFSSCVISHLSHLFRFNGSHRRRILLLWPKLNVSKNEQRKIEESKIDKKKDYFRVLCLLAKQIFCRRSERETKGNIEEDDKLRIYFKWLIRTFNKT